MCLITELNQQYKFIVFLNTIAIFKAISQLALNSELAALRNQVLFTKSDDWVAKQKCGMA
jgi:hypothetical protein